MAKQPVLRWSVMDRVSQLLRLTPEKRGLLFNALWWLGITRLGLSILPFQTLRTLLQKYAAQPRSHPAIISLENVHWAVSRASRVIPGSTCLTQALAAQSILAQHGLPSHLHIGFMRD